HPLRVHAGALQPRGHAIECRITAEDPFNDFLPATGVIRHLQPPSGPGVRWDGGVEAGNEVTLFYDSLLAKLIVWGDTRTTALQRMRRALRELVIVGLPSSQPFHLRVMADPEFQRGDVDVTYLERVGQRLLAAELYPELARPLAVAAALLAEEQRAAAPPPPTARFPDGPSAWTLAARRESIGGWSERSPSPPAPPGVAASCPHYVSDRCGGCQLQHLSYDAQLAAKRAIVGDALRRIGKLDVPDPEIVEAVEEWRYRAKVSLAVEGGRGRAKAVGLHPYDQPGRVFPLVDCHITDFRLMALWRELKPRLDLLPPRLTRLTLRLDRDGRRHILAESSGEPWLDAERLRAALPQGDTVVCWWHPVDGAARVVAGPATGFPATAFEQVHPE